MPITTAAQLLGQRRSALQIDFDAYLHVLQERNEYELTILVQTEDARSLTESLLSAFSKRVGEYL